jgi:hypothetical protein
LLAARRVFPIAAPGWALSALSAHESAREALARDLGVSPWRDRIQAFRVLPTWAERAQLLREHLLPPPEYVMARYGRRSTLVLPALYLHRAFGGAWRLWRHAPR